MSVAVVTGAAGLVGSATCRHLAGLGLDVVGIDNDMRARFFGPAASTAATRDRLRRELGPGYVHHDVDVRDRSAIDAIFAGRGRAVALVVHAAGQPSHDWAAGDPTTDFDVNATGTFNVIDATRRHAPDAAFVFISSNKVYGDTPNALPLVEQPTRLELVDHPFAGGIDETMTIDGSMHSLMGVSKLAADVAVQEHGRYFDMPTACLRAGTITGPEHAAAEQHGFLAYVVRCAMTGTPYSVHGYGGRQVRDVIHCDDLVLAIDAIFGDPRPAEVFNVGGGRVANVSVLEAIELVQELTGEAMTWSVDEQPRRGDHRWWISSNAHLRSRFPEWHVRLDVPAMVKDLIEANRDRWHR